MSKRRYRTPRREPLPVSWMRPIQSESDDTGRKQKREIAEAEKKWAELLGDERFDAPERMAI